MTDPLRIDWRNFISPPFRTCAFCKIISRGTASIRNGFVVYRCRECGARDSERLPTIEKSLIYLDQMALSNMAKSLDPVWQADRGKQDPYWIKLFDQLDRLLKLNLIICPSSPIHEKESSVTAYDDVLRRLTEHLANGIELEFPVRVLSEQLHVGLDAYLSEKDPDFSVIKRTRLLNRDPNAWTERLRVSVNIPTSSEEVDRYRHGRDRAHEAFSRTVWPQWQSEGDKTFDDWYQEERAALSEVYLTLYGSWLESSVGEEVWNPRLEVMVVKGLISKLERSGFDAEEARRSVRAFLISEPALRSPQNEISALLLASMARKAATGQKKPPSRGMWNDVQAVSAYMPYVDAMFVDDQIAGLLREQPLKRRTAGYARVFSNNTREAFMEYLHEIEQTAVSDHIGRVKRIYGDEWLTPFREILEHERSRQR